MNESHQASLPSYEINHMSWALAIVTAPGLYTLITSYLIVIVSPATDNRLRRLPFYRV